MREWLRSVRPGVAALLASIPLAVRAEAAFCPPDPQLGFIIGALVGMPMGVAAVLVEAILPRRRVRGAVVLAVALAAAAVGVLLNTSRPPFNLVARWAYPLLLCASPALVVLALRSAIPNPWLRLAAGWALAFALLAFAMMARADPRALDNAGLTLLVGAAATSIVPWSIALLVLGVAGLAPPDAAERYVALRLSPGMQAAGRRAVKTVRREAAEFLALLGPARRGLLWWLGSATLIHVGFGLAIAFGIPGALRPATSIMGLLDFLGWRMPARSNLAGTWWLLGLPWSLMTAGAVWGLAGLFGAFDPGRMRGLRLASILIGTALIVWSA